MNQERNEMSDAHWELVSHLIDYGSLAAILVLSAVAAIALARTPTPSDHTNELRDAA